MGQRAGSKVGAVLDTKNKVKDKANAVKENIKDMPTQTAYAAVSYTHLYVIFLWDILIKTVWEK